MAKTSEDRITELEIQLAHVQRMFDQLNEVVTEQALRLDQVVAHQKKLSEKIAKQQNDGDSPVDPLSEKPPHY
ncbi:MAG: SlyX family protein [Pirellulaceae bacterium]